jgi:hypothetical protein
MRLRLVVAAGLRPAVEPGILPGEISAPRPKRADLTSSDFSGRQDARPLRQARRMPLQLRLGVVAEQWLLRVLGRD